MNFNKCIIAGRLTRDPEMRVTPKGTAITQFSVAYGRKYKSDSGQESEETSFFDCEAWAKTGELIAKHFTKGKAIMIECRAKQDTWEDKNTKEKRSKVKFVVESFQFVGSRSEDNQAAPKSAQAPASKENLDEDAPF
jgi:single-strand DNA-binding protein